MGPKATLRWGLWAAPVIFGAAWIVLFSRGISHHPPSTVQWKKFSRSRWNRAMCHNVHNVAGWCCWVLGYRHWGEPYLVQKWGISRNWESSNKKGYSFSKRAFINVPITVAVDKVFAEIFRSYSRVSLPLEPAVSDWRMERFWHHIASANLKAIAAQWKQWVNESESPESPVVQACVF